MERTRILLIKSVLLDKSHKIQHDTLTILKYPGIIDCNLGIIYGERFVTNVLLRQSWLTLEIRRNCFIKVKEDIMFGLKRPYIKFENKNEKSILLPMAFVQRRATFFFKDLIILIIINLQKDKGQKDSHEVQIASSKFH